MGLESGVSVSLTPRGYNCYNLIPVVTFLQMYNKIDAGETLTVDAVIDYLKRKFPRAGAERILGVDSEYDEKRQVRK